MNPYQFRLVLSGPCAYVPNRIMGGGPPPSAWSAIMPQLKLGPTVVGPSVGTFSLRPHYTVLQYPTAFFEADSQPDLIFQLPGGPEFGVIALDGERIRMVSTEKPLFVPGFCGLTLDQLKVGGNPLNRTCLDWLPPMQRLLSGAEFFGRNDTAYFNANGFPAQGTMGAHILLDRGNLVADSLVPKEFSAATEVPPLWAFRDEGSIPTEVALQSVAYTLALEMNQLSHPVQIVIESAAKLRTVTLKQGVTPPSVLEIEVKNREFDEIVRFAAGEIRVGGVDKDFIVLYSLSQTETRACPLPHLVREGGVGTRRATCGGALLVGFKSGFEPILAKW